MKLYFFPQTRATRARWMLEELGVPYETVTVDLMKGEHKQPPYTKVHPLGVVPALEDNGQTIIESAAIVMYLADKFPEKGLAPAVGTHERAQYYQWIVFAMTEMDPHGGTMAQHTLFLPESERSPGAVAWASQRYTRGAKVVAQSIEGRDFLVGNRFTAADVVMGGVLMLGNRFGLLKDFPPLQAYLGRLMERPAAKKVYG